MNLDYKPIYTRNLPHIQPPRATFLVTFRLAGSLPAQVIEQLRTEQKNIEQKLFQISDKGEKAKQLDTARRQGFAKFDALLDKTNDGPTWLKDPAIAQIVVDALWFLNNKMYELDSYCVMSNHVHVVFTPLNERSTIFQNRVTDSSNEGSTIFQNRVTERPFALQRIMYSLKRFTATGANKLLQRKGQFWQNESYDHIVRDEGELNRIRQYILQNPVKAGLVSCWEEWKWSFCKAILENRSTGE